MVCGHKLTEHYHVWGKGWKRRANKEYDRLKDAVENSGANASIAKQRIEEYKKRVEDSRVVFDESQKELIERIEILQNTVIARDYIESAFILEYRLLLETGEDERFPSGRRKAELEKTIESCGLKSELQRISEKAWLTEPEIRPILNDDAGKKDEWVDETQDNSLNLFDLMSKQKHVIQSLSVDAQVDRALQEARDFLHDSSTTRRAPKKHTRRRTVSDAILSSAKSRGKKKEDSDTDDGWRQQLIAGVMKGLNRKEFEPSRSRSASPPLRDRHPGVVTPKLSVGNPMLKEDEIRNFNPEDDSDSSADVVPHINRSNDMVESPKKVRPILPNTVV